MDEPALISLATALGAGLGALGKGLLDWQKTRSRAHTQVQAQERADNERIRLDLRERVRELEKRLDEVNDKLDQTQEQLRKALTQLALALRENQDLRDHMLSAGTYPILVIHDDPSMRHFIEAVLSESSRLNFQITNAESLEAGIREAYRSYFTAILLCLNLGDSKGAASLERLSREVPNVPIVVLTGSENPEELKQARLLGATSVVQKSTALNKRDLTRELVLARETHRTRLAVERRVQGLSIPRNPERE